MGQYRIISGDSSEELKKIPDNSIDAVVTDPPAGIGFMGKEWDKDKGGRDEWIKWMQVIATEVYRTMKPGAHALVWALPRTSHWTAMAWENAGFQIRDVVAHVFGSGFPKSHDVSKAIAKRAGGELAAKDAISFMRERREELGLSRVEFERLIFGRSDGNVRNWEDGISLPKPGLWNEIKRAMGLEVTPFDADMERGDVVIGVEDGSYGYQKTDARWENKRVVRSPATPEAKQWEGWGTALKPSREDWILLRKPIVGTVAQNVLQYGTGGLNVDGCRVEGAPPKVTGQGWNGSTGYGRGDNADLREFIQPQGRWPANLIHDGSEEVVGLFPESNGGAFPKKSNIPTGRHYDGGWGAVDNKERTEMGNGSASRFYYVAKASKRDRNEGLDCFEIISIFGLWEKEVQLARVLVNTATSPPKVTVESTAQNKNACEWSTLLFGSEFMAQFQMDTKSTTLTKTNSITESKTLNALAHCITKGFIQGVNFAMTDGGNLAESADNSTTLVLTTSEKTALALGADLVALPTLLRISAKDGTNIHSTVKPTDLMRYLCRLITPIGGTVLDPFTGSGSTGKAAILEGFNFIGIEREPEYVAIAEARISHVTKESPHKSAPKPIITEPKPEKLTKSPQLSLF